jgi:hypothetical protein
MISRVELAAYLSVSSCVTAAFLGHPWALVGLAGLLLSTSLRNRGGERTNGEKRSA